jgi:hypothetical protein
MFFVISLGGFIGNKTKEKKKNAQKWDDRRKVINKDSTKESTDWTLE